MLDLTSFDYDSQVVRTVMIDGAPWFVAVDVCRILDIANSRDALERLDDDEKGVATTDTLGGPQQMNVVSESGLYALIFTSRKAEARAFRKWVTATVLPSLRQEGAFVMEPAAQNPALNPAFDMARQDVGNWLSMVREARLLRGPAAALRIWDASPLPSLNDPQSVDYAGYVSDAAQFIAQCCTVTGLARDVVTADDLAAAYGAWIRSQGGAERPLRTLFLALTACASRYVCAQSGLRFRKVKSGVMIYTGLILNV